jgi:hypothetical protein
MRPPSLVPVPFQAPGTWRQNRWLGTDRFAFKFNCNAKPTFERWWRIDARSLALRICFHIYPLKYHQLRGGGLTWTIFGVRVPGRRVDRTQNMHVPTFLCMHLQYKT